jgi:hypothetical protein
VITVHNVIAEVRKLAAEKPDNCYVPTDAWGGCCYDKGQCTDGSVGCIFGQALQRLGRPITGCGSITQALCDSRWFEPLTIDLDNEVEWCKLVQQYQDANLSWGKAVESANRLYPLPSTTETVT